ncbi:Retrovirus-related Pol polyprotein from transposon 297 [Mytilus edulis]|nr:Retrovirus-related Pol polyprotein from transposon 297 [Mytilus edulis]
MGLHTAPNSFQLLMDKILRGLTFKSCLCYLDDVLICSETFEQHMSDLQEVFDRFRNAGLKLNPQKCTFANSSAIFLGHHISKEGIRPPPDRVRALNEFPPPQNVKQLRRALGMFNWFRKFIPNYSSAAEPLTRLLKKSAKFVWSQEQETSFTRIKHLLLTSAVLAFPRFDLQFFLAVDS